MSQGETPDTAAADRRVLVGIGLIERAGRYLVRQRPQGSLMAGYWEFPGGKCEPGESPEEAARRECREETGLDVEVVRLRREVDHRYPHAWVAMSFFDCRPRHPDAEPAPSSGFLWIEARSLAALTFPGANDAILEELAHEAAPPPAGA